MPPAAEHWATPPIICAPKPKTKGKGNARPVRLVHGGAFGMDAAAQEEALALLHKHGYDTEMALAELREASKPTAAFMGWSATERTLT